jgi:hypothetical protein
MPEGGRSSTIDTNTPHFCILCKELRTGLFRGGQCTRCYARQYIRRPGIREKIREYNYLWRKQDKVKLKDRLRYEKKKDTPEYNARKRRNLIAKKERELSSHAAIAQKMLLAKLSSDPLPVVEMNYNKRYRQRPEVKRKEGEYRREYEQRPEVIAMRAVYYKEYEQRSEVRAMRRKYKQSPEYKQKARGWYQKYELHRPGASRARKAVYYKEYEQRSEVRARRAEYERNPAVKARRAEYRKKHKPSTEARERYNASRRERYALRRERHSALRREKYALRKESRAKKRAIRLPINDLFLVRLGDSRS